MNLSSPSGFSATAIGAKFASIILKIFLANYTFHIAYYDMKRIVIVDVTKINNNSRKKFLFVEIV